MTKSFLHFRPLKSGLPPISPTPHPQSRLCWKESFCMGNILHLGVVLLTHQQSVWQSRMRHTCLMSMMRMLSPLVQLHTSPHDRKCAFEMCTMGMVHGCGWAAAVLQVQKSQAVPRAPWGHSFCGHCLTCRRL